MTMTLKAIPQQEFKRCF